MSWHPDAPYDVLVLRTDIHTDEKQVLADELLNESPGVISWSVDRSDKDKVLRVEATGLSTVELVRRLSERGIDCAELE